MPLDVSAWLIAIEKYEGAELNVKAPVGAWALDLAEILLKRGVTSIVLSSSFNENATYAPRLAALQSAGVVRTGATQAEVQNALEKLRGKGALLIYWVGHGIMAPERQLLCADSRKASQLRVLSEDSLLKHLRSPEFPRLQIGFFECCAQIVAGSPAILDLGGDGKTDTRQFFFHAASATESATADSTRVGFSSTAIAALRDSAEFPPESPSFFAGLIATMRALPLATRPFLLEWTDESGDKWSRYGQTHLDDISQEARVAHLLPSQFERLWREARKGDANALDLAGAVLDDKLKAFTAGLDKGVAHLLTDAADQLALQREFEKPCLSLRLSWKDWLNVYDRLVIDNFIEKPEGIVDLQGLLLAALDRSNVENGRNIFVTLLELASRRVARQNPAAAAELTAALSQHASLGPVYTGVLAELPKQDSHIYLLLGLVWDPNAKLALLENARLFRGPDTGFEPRALPTSGTLAERINDVIQNVKEAFDGDLVIELLVPNELLSTPRELLEVNYPGLPIRSWLEASHSISLRWHNRMKGSYDRGTWMQIARAARAHAENAQSLFCSWPPERTAVAGWHVAGLSIPGPCPSEPSRNGQAFFTELLKGFPYMCWPRNTVQDADAFRSAASELFGGSTLNRAPLSLRERRQDHALLADLILFIDDPDRNPYLDTLTETAQRGI